MGRTFALQQNHYRSPDDVSDVDEQASARPIVTSRDFNSCQLWRPEYPFAKVCSPVQEAIAFNFLLNDPTVLHQELLTLHQTIQECLGLSDTIMTVGLYSACTRLLCFDPSSAFRNMPFDISE